jgi:hypothetical protein
MRKGILRQFREERESLLGFPTENPPTHDGLGLCFEVLEATVNSTDNAMPGGGNYFLERFSSSIM